MCRDCLYVHLQHVNISPKINYSAKGQISVQNSNSLTVISALKDAVYFSMCVPVN